MPTDLQSRFAWDDRSVAAFEAYHDANPHVYAALLRFALEARDAGRHRLSINMLFERVRWFTDVEGRGDSFKLNNNWRAYYARLLMAHVPALEGFFETRAAKADAA